MAGPNKSNRMRAPVMSAFRSAFASHDAKKRVDERDEGGERVLAGRRASGRGAISESALQQAVSLDLETLMNTTSIESTLDLDEFAEVRRSVLNYGFPDIVHRTIDELNVQDVAGEIAASLAAYEPRLVPGSVHVVRDTSIDEAELRVRFVVKADLNCDPLNLPVEFVADVDRNTGKILIASQ